LRSIDDILTPSTIKYLRWAVAITVTIAASCVFYAAWIELNHPGTGNDCESTAWAYRFMYLTGALAIPLWIAKIKALKSFFDNLRNLYDGNETAIDEAVHREIRRRVKAHAPEIIATICVTLIAYVVVTNFIITPELTQSYQDHFVINYSIGGDTP
jgi:hypothetical protein